MNCDHATELICARLADELSSDDRGALDTHLASCEACRAAAEVLRAQDEQLRAAFAPRRTAAVAVADRVISKVRAAKPPSARRFPRWLTPLLSAAAGFLIAVGIFRPWERPASIVDPGTTPVVQVPKETLQLTLATGPVEARAAGQDAWSAVPAGATVAVGCSVRTPEKSRCEFRCADGSEVRLNSGTEVAFHGDRKLDLVRGQILASVADAPSPFAVKVEDATVTAEGTKFDLWRQPEETRLAVLEGKIRVDGKTVQGVDAGYIARIVAGRVENLHKPREQRDLVNATEWVHELLLLKSRDNPELSRRVDALLAQIGDTKMATLSEADIRALGDHCVLPLTRFIQSDISRRHEDRRRDAARILADLAQPWSIPDLIKLLDDADGRVRAAAATGLHRLTSKTFQCPPDAWCDRSPRDLQQPRGEWQKWWEQNKDRYPKPP